MQEEKWKDIPGYDGIYQMSNLRNVKSIQRYDKRGRLLKERILTPTIIGNAERVNLTKNGKVKVEFLNRLYYEMFEKKG